MTPENQAKLLQAYKMSIEACQDGIADILEDVILGEMEHAKPTVTFRDAYAMPETTPKGFPFESLDVKCATDGSKTRGVTS